MTSGTEASGKTRSVKTRFKKPLVLPAPAVVRAKEAKILKISGDHNILEKLGVWFKKGREFKAIGVEDCMLDGKRCTAVIFESPNPRKPTEMERFAVVKADVVLKKTATKH